MRNVPSFFTTPKAVLANVEPTWVQKAHNQNYGESAVPADREFVDYLEKVMYHPRSSEHGDKLCILLLQDLLRLCEPFNKAAKERRIVYRLNYVIDKGSPTQWNLDLVVGPPALKAQQLLESNDALLLGEPAEIWLAIDAKTIMTEHCKARRNRQRDLNSLQDILHRKNRRTIVGGLLVVNIADSFKSPLRPEITIHRNIRRIVQETIDLFKGLPLAKSAGTGLDGLGIIVVSHTNTKGDSSRLFTEEPAPQPGDSLHYLMFLQDICSEFKKRYPAS